MTARIGFTGTQTGMTDKQKNTLASIFLSLQEMEFHHGDCIGADEQAHRMAQEWYSNIVIHPPIISTKRAYCSGGFVRPPRPFLDRNRDIVDATEIMIAIPKSSQEEQRSGTWATVRYARKKNRPLVIINPDGSAVYERWGGGSR